MACPFCRIGKRELDEALARFAHRERVEVRWRSFELDPAAPAGTGEPALAMLQRRYGIGEQEARQRVRGVADRGAALGLAFDFGRTLSTSTFHAHRLLHAARAMGVEEAVLERLFEAHFAEGALISDRKALLRLGAEAGMDRAEAQRALEGDAYAAEVRADEREARELGIQGVPFFVFGRRFAVSGAQGSGTFLRALEEAWGSPEATSK